MNRAGGLAPRRAATEQRGVCDASRRTASGSRRIPASARFCARRVHGVPRIPRKLMAPWHQACLMRVRGTIRRASCHGMPCDARIILGMLRTIGGADGGCASSVTDSNRRSLLRRRPRPRTRLLQKQQREQRRTTKSADRRPFQRFRRMVRGWWCQGASPPCPSLRRLGSNKELKLLGTLLSRPWVCTRRRLLRSPYTAADPPPSPARVTDALVARTAPRSRGRLAREPSAEVPPSEMAEETREPLEYADHGLIPRKPATVRG